MWQAMVMAGVLVAAGPAGGDERDAQQALASSLARYQQSEASRGPASAGDAQPSELAANLREAPHRNWLAFGRQLEAEELAVREANRAASRPALIPAEANLPYIPWRKRHGPAYPGDFWTSWGRWGKEMPETLWDDTKALATNWVSLAGLAAAGAAGIAINASGADDKVADFYTKHGSQLNRFWDNVGDVGGNPGTHFAVAGAMLLTSLARMDSDNFEKASALMNALAINGLLTVGLKVATRTRSPNGDPLGWPSGHTSSSFTFATVVYEEYGPLVGVPLFAFASYVGYERIDARNHDFSDVISGALIGMAVGHAVAQNHMPRIAGFQVVPIADPANGTMGVALARSW